MSRSGPMRVASGARLSRACGSGKQRKYSEHDRQKKVMQKMRLAENNSSPIRITPHQGIMHAPGAPPSAPASAVEGGLRADHQLRTDAGTTRCLFGTGACRRQCDVRNPGAEGQAEGAAAEGGFGGA